MDKLIQKIHSLLLDTLYLSCPVLSSNMRNHIEIGSVVGENEMSVVITAPYYDQTEWNKHKKIVLTGKAVNGKYHYAEEVNLFGAFGKGNKSMHWVNRACMQVATVIANEIGATVINELEL